MNDSEIEKLIHAEIVRQQGVVNLIASENIVSNDVLTAMGSVFTNKYAEGYPGKRYYGGNSVVDELELLCQTRALSAFGLSPDEWSVNVQAYSGSPANMASLAALAPMGATIMGMSLTSGGHLTHGYTASMTGKVWNAVSYDVDPITEIIDYDAVEKLVMEHKPAVIIAGYTAYPRRVDWARFRSIADNCGAYLMCDISHISGLIAGGVYPSPFPYADVVTTTTHKMLRGPRGALIFSRRDDRKLPHKIDKAVFPGLQGGPHMNAIAGIAVALREATVPEFREYAQQVIDCAAAAARAMSSCGWRIVSGGTDSHLVLIDTWMNGVGIGGKEASEKLESAGIIVNMNSIPFDSRSPLDPSGIRIGFGAFVTVGGRVSDISDLVDRVNTALRG
jgi:glycine hydroxymethyltransferase